MSEAVDIVEEVDYHS